MAPLSRICNPSPPPPPKKRKRPAPPRQAGKAKKAAETLGLKSEGFGHRDECGEETQCAPPTFAGSPLFYRPLPRQFQPPRCKLTDLQIADWPTLICSFYKGLHRNLPSPHRFWRCQFTFWSLKFSFGGAIPNRSVSACSKSQYFRDAKPPRESCNNTVPGRVLRRLSKRKCFLDGSEKAFCKGSHICV